MIAAIHFPIAEWAREYLPPVLQWGIPLIWVAAVYIAISRPLRRYEQARFLIDVMQSAVDQGLQIETYIQDLSRTRDPVLGARFHLLSAYLESGLTLVPALQNTPGLLPPQLVAMLKAGAHAGNFATVLPVCRKLLRDGVSQSRAAVNYQAVFALILTPAVLVVIPLVQSRVMPAFIQIFASFGSTLPAIVGGVFRWMPFLFALNLLLILALVAAAVLFLGGPRFPLWIEAGLWSLSDWIYLHVPWRRKRLYRDFSGMLGTLLDNGLPEERAMALAAESTANKTFIARVHRVVNRLENGVKLPEAISALDDSGEFRWRLANSAHHSNNFQRALKGWQDSLDATAFQQEQSIAQLISTGMILLNGTTVFLAAAGVLAALASLSAVALRNFP